MENTALTKLDLGGLNSKFCNEHFIISIIDNAIGEQGLSALVDSQKRNPSLASLNMSCEKSQMKSHATKIEMPFFIS